MDAEMMRKTETLAGALQASDSVIVGAGAGLSTAAGLQYTGARFDRFFGDFSRSHGFRDMYAGGFFPYATLEEHWAYWSRYVWINRYAPIPKDTYRLLHQLLEGKDAFAITTNVDHCFQRAGFSKERLFYTQGDYGLFQCSRPCCAATWDNEDAARAMVEAQGFIVAPDGELVLPDGAQPAMTVPSELVPSCPSCGRPASMNLRADATFVEDAGWHAASARYDAFLQAHAVSDERVLFLELGVGGNTPVIIKYPFWRMTAVNENVTYACVNLGEAWAPEQIGDRALLLDADIHEVLEQMVAINEETGGMA